MEAKVAALEAKNEKIIREIAEAEWLIKERQRYIDTYKESMVRTKRRL